MLRPLEIFILLMRSLILPLLILLTFSTAVFAENLVNSSCSNTKKEGLRIFVSFSMPETLLISLDQQARKVGAKLVIRGLKNNSFRETFSYIKSMSDKGMVIDIDAGAFEEFSVTQVPSFVLNNVNHFDKITGNVSIPYVLKQFVEKGDLRDKASQYLRRLENGNK